jgi:ComF family protein
MLRSVYSKVRDAFISLSWPQVCRVCGRMVDSYEDGVACSSCWTDPAVTTLLFNKQVCEKCGLPLIGADRDRCARCAGFTFTAARSCGLYRGAIKTSILYLKSQPHLCPRLARILDETFAANLTALSCDLIVPVPLHPRRERERGFNQAEVISRKVASQFNLALDVRSLARVKHTERHRIGMDRADRTKSVERAFRVERPRMVGGCSVLLVDDVLTTGSTIDEASRVLLESGANRVCVLTIARVA